jgi:alpha-amylase/alpha-mannosidase (GH57 family)
MNRYVCIHGHFYQPPRENAWLEEIEIQDSARPYHDWNERITAECYAPNAASRILDESERICDIVNNYSRISFNFGPTLLSWLEDHARTVYDAIIEADHLSRKRFSGHGSAIAQVYNHVIMPLADSRDKETQVAWGIRDFEYRFRRKPEGMWLAETAVDLDTLEALARHGIAFTILAPHQAARVRKISRRRRETVLPLDTSQAYLCRLPSGRSITLFFYNGAVAHDVAFGEVLRSGVDFAARLCDGFVRDRRSAQLVHIATDGETFGHHHKFGDMALSYCLRHIESSRFARLAVYGQYLERFPPTHEVEIAENTSWSCAHGIERWRKDCGCNSGRAGWTQAWRAPLREALDWLRDSLRPVYERGMSEITLDAWKARDLYIDCILDRRPERVEQFFSEIARRNLTREEKMTALSLLEMQRHAQLMFTSCGWFFDEISGLETTQILQYAARAIQLAEKIGRVSLEPAFIEKLRSAPSNFARYLNGAAVYEKMARSSMVDLPRVAAHWAVSSLFEDYAETETVFSYTVHCEAREQMRSGHQRLVTGKMHLRSNITRAEDRLSFAALHLGDHNLLAGVGRYADEEGFEQMQQALRAAFNRGDSPEVIRLMEKLFEKHSYSLVHLFKDEKRRVLGLILKPSLAEIEREFRHLWERFYPAMQMLKEMKAPVPPSMISAAEFAINVELQEAIDGADASRIESLIEEIDKWSFEIDKPRMEIAVSRKITSLMESFRQTPSDSALAQIECLLAAAELLSLNVDVWKAQNILFEAGRKLPARGRRAYRERLTRVADYLGVKVD